MLTTIFTFLSNTIFSSEIIADIPSLKDSILNEHRRDYRARLIALRMIIWIFCVLFAISTDKFNLILQFAGSIFTPFCSFFIPIILYYQYQKFEENEQIGKIKLESPRMLFGVNVKYIVDGAYIGMCSIITWYGLKSTLLS